MLNLTRREAVLAAIGATALAVPALADKSKEKNQEGLDAVRDLLKAHNDAFTSQDLEGVMATLSHECVIMGTAPGELWGGHKEIIEAYRHFFEDFDKGKQTFETLWHDGNVGPAGAWMMSVSKVTMTKGTDTKEFGLNLSVTCEKHKGQWKIRAMHFSNLTGAVGA